MNNDAEQLIGYKEEIRLVNNQRKRLLVRSIYAVYPMITTNLNVGATQPVTFQFESDWDFMLEGFTYMADIAGGAQTDSTRVVPLVRVQLTENNINYFQSQVDITSIAGTGQLPYVLSEPKRIAAKTALNAAFFNYSNATIYANVALYLHGQKTQVVQDLGVVA